MKYAVLGAGGTGGMIGFQMAEAGMDVTLIARGEHLEAIRKNGLTVSRIWCHTRKTIRVPAFSAEEYDDRPDVIFVCVKGYSIDAVLPFLQRVAGPETVIIPILNIFGTGGRIQKDLPGVAVTDGCIYVASDIKEPGVIRQSGEILRVIFGIRTGETCDEKTRAKLQAIEQDLKAAGIDGRLSEHIERDCLQKFSYVSPAGAAGLFYDAKAKDLQQEGPAREMFKAMITEITDLAAAMGYPFDNDYVKINLEILSRLDPTSDTSMQRDVAAGKQSELDGLVFEVVRLCDQYDVAAPTYRMAAQLLEKKYK